MSPGNPFIFWGSQSQSQGYKSQKYCRRGSLALFAVSAGLFAFQTASPSSFLEFISLTYCTHI